MFSCSDQIWFLDPAGRLPEANQKLSGSKPAACHHLHITRILLVVNFCVFPHCSLANNHYERQYLETQESQACFNIPRRVQSVITSISIYILACFKMACLFFVNSIYITADIIEFHSTLMRGHVWKRKNSKRFLALHYDTIRYHLHFHLYSCKF